MIISVADILQSVKIPVPTRHNPTEGTLEDSNMNKRKPRGGANRLVAFVKQELLDFKGWLWNGLIIEGRTTLYWIIDFVGKG